MTIARRVLLIAAALGAFAAPAIAQNAPAALSARAGWVVHATPHAYATLIERVENAIQANKMGLVNFASASDGAKAQGFAIAGNRVIGVFRNDYARRMLAASIPAGIEAPIRLYLTENADGKATLSYRTPSAVFGPYFEGAGADLRKLSEELDMIFVS
ncbi:MAG: DUF302 domain-containing protein, partial [Beijerinckiaceae bacterium]